MPHEPQWQILSFNVRLYPFFQHPQIFIVRCIPNFLSVRFMSLLAWDLGGLWDWTDLCLHPCLAWMLLVCRIQTKHNWVRRESIVLCLRTYSAVPTAPIRKNRFLMKLAVAFRLERAQIQYEFSARCALH